MAIDIVVLLNNPPPNNFEEIATSLHPRVPELLLSKQELTDTIDSLVEGFTDDDMDRLIPPEDLIAVVWEFMEAHASSVVSYIFNQQPKSAEQAVHLFEEILHDPARDLKAGVRKVMSEAMWRVQPS